MTETQLNVVIVDPLNFGGTGLRASFVAAGAKTHVVRSFEAAAKIVENSQVDAAVLEFKTDKKTTAFLRLLTARKIPFIFTSEPPELHQTANASGAVVAAISKVIANRGRVGAHSPLCD